MTRVSIHSLELTPLECEVLSEIMAAKLEQHIADRKRAGLPFAVVELVPDAKEEAANADTD